MGAEWEIKYHPLNKPIPEGWERHDGLDGTHHGDHATFIVKMREDIKARYPVTLARLAESPTLCECGQPLKTIDEGGHVRTACCGRISRGVLRGFLVVSQFDLGINSRKARQSWWRRRVGALFAIMSVFAPQNGAGFAPTVSVSWSAGAPGTITTSKPALPSATAKACGSLSDVARSPMRSAVSSDIQENQESHIPLPMWFVLGSMFIVLLGGILGIVFLLRAQHLRRQQGAWKRC